MRQFASHFRSRVPVLGGKSCSPALLAYSISIPLMKAVAFHVVKRTTIGPLLSAWLGILLPTTLRSASGCGHDRNSSAPVHLEVASVARTNRNEVLGQHLPGIDCTILRH